jgi:SAM-dependent methyltransferase
MNATRPDDAWNASDPYEAYVGRWSWLVAHEFLAWLALPSSLRWIDVGCGTGSLTAAIAAQSDVLVSGLVLNSVPDTGRGLAEMRRVVVPGGTIAAYVWDYAGKMELMRHFWDAAVALDTNVRDLDEGVRFPLCCPDALETAFRDAGLVQIALVPIDVPTRFRDFDDYWSPFLGGQGPAPSYAMSLGEDARIRLREHLRARLRAEADGSIALVARAWAVRGRVPG